MELGPAATQSLGARYTAFVTDLTASTRMHVASRAAAYTMIARGALSTSSGIWTCAGSARSVTGRRARSATLAATAACIRCFMAHAACGAMPALLRASHLATRPVLRSEAGASAAELKAAGYSASSLLEAGYGAADLQGAGFSAADLKRAGLKLADVEDLFRLTELRAAGFMPDGTQQEACSICWVRPRDTAF